MIAEPIWWARSTGKREEILCCAASMVLELWEFADQLRRSLGKCARELVHESGWTNASTAKILHKLALSSAVAGAVLLDRPPACHDRARTYYLGPSFFRPLDSPAAVQCPSLPTRPTGTNPALRDPRGSGEGPSHSSTIGASERAAC